MAAGGSGWRRAQLLPLSSSLSQSAAGPRRIGVRAPPCGGAPARSPPARQVNVDEGSRRGGPGAGRPWRAGPGMSGPQRHSTRVPRPRRKRATAAAISVGGLRRLGSMRRWSSSAIPRHVEAPLQEWHCMFDEMRLTHGYFHSPKFGRHSYTSTERFTKT